MSNNLYSVRYVTFSGMNLVTKERSFKSDDARAQFLDKLEEAGDLHSVLAYADPS